MSCGIAGGQSRAGQGRGGQGRAGSVHAYLQRRTAHTVCFLGGCDTDGFPREWDCLEGYRAASRIPRRQRTELIAFHRTAHPKWAPSDLACHAATRGSCCASDKPAWEILAWRTQPPTLLEPAVDPWIATVTQGLTPSIEGVTHIVEGAVEEGRHNSRRTQRHCCGCGCGYGYGCG